MNRDISKKKFERSNKKENKKDTTSTVKIVEKNTQKYIFHWISTSTGIGKTKIQKIQKEKVKS